MIVTETEASETVCPIVTVFVGPETHRWQGLMITSRGDRVDTPGAFGCIGRKCMWWRWGNGESDTWKKPDGSYHYGQTVGTHAAGERGEATEGWQMVGYCGKAGKP